MERTNPVVKGKRFRLTVFIGEEIISFSAGIKAVQNRLSGKRGTSETDMLRSIFSTRFIMSKYSSTSNKQDFYKYWDADMMIDAITTGRSESDSMVYVFVRP